MNKILFFLYRFSVTILTLLLWLFIFPKTASAQSLNWHLSYPISAPDGNTEIKIADSDASTVFASNRKHNGTFDILKSTDRGQSWTSVKNNILAGSDANWISIKHSNKDIIALSVWEAGIYLSENGGSSWSNIFNQPYPRAVAINPVSTDVIFAGISDSNSGLYSSINKGVNWRLATLGSGNSVIILIDPNNPDRVFGNISGGLYRSVDSGNTWSPPLAVSGGFSSIAIDVNTPDIVYVTTDIALYKSTDGGNTWSPKINGIGNAFFFRVAQDKNGDLYTSVRGIPGGIWRSKDAGEHWENISDPIWSNVETWGMDVKDGRVYVGVLGFGIFIANTDGTPINPPQEVVCDSLSVTPSLGNSPLTVNAVLSGHTINGGSVENYIFDFGDGSKFYPIPTNSRLHIYNSAGTFTVNGHVVDNLGHVSSDSDSCRTTVTVTNPLPPVTVVVPGLGASWNAEAILNCDLTTVGDWTLASYAEPVYQPIIDALARAGVENRLFAYDWRKRVFETSHVLKGFLDTFPEGQPANLVGHSLGGLVGRAYLEQYGQDHRLSKYLSVGSPHQGATDAYYPWEGGDIKLNNFVQKLAVQLLLRHCGGLTETDREVIQAMVPSLRNLLPIYSYLKDWKTGEINSNPIWLNDWLQAPFSVPDNIIFGTLSGTGFETSKIIRVKGRSFLDTALGNWDDGKPAGKETTFEGDSTVTTESSQLPGPTNIVIGQDHSGLIAANEGINQIFNFLGIPTALPLSAFSEPRSALIIIGYPASFSVEDKDGKITNDKNNLVSVLNPRANRYKFDLIPNSDNTLFIIGQFLENGKVLWKEYHLSGKERKEGFIQFDPKSPSEDPLKL